MKLLSPILLGIGLLSAATASDSTNYLRANTSARQLSFDMSGSDGGFMYFLFLNGLNAVGDITGGPDSCCCNDSLLRCHHPHAPCLPPAKKHCSSHSGSSGSSSGGSDKTYDGSSASSSSSNYSSNYSNNSGGGDSSYYKSANDDNSGENDNGNNQGNDNGSGEDQYLEFNQYNGGNGNATQITGGQSISVWPILIAAIAIGAVAAALVATKKLKRSEQPDHVLNGSVRKRMELFRGGMFRKEQTTASSALCENGYVNES